MKAYIGVTDGDWHRFLAERPELTEINFWRPSTAREFRAITVGEPFFFKSHYPHNRIVGGGFYSGFAALTISQAWEYFGEANGVKSLEEMRQLVDRYRRARIPHEKDPLIGCILVRDPRFFPEELQVDPPSDFAPNLVQGKSFDLATRIDSPYFGELLDKILGAHAEIDITAPWHRPGPVYSDPRLAPQRLGQRSFQAVVLNAYHQRCAITGCKIRPVLQAAHIRPLPQGGEHRLDNGILLRSDVHTLYDRGYLAIDPKYRLLASPHLREFDNDNQYNRRIGNRVIIPDRPQDRPNREFLEWHLEEVFLAS